jgi:hypothetical protein
MIFSGYHQSMFQTLRPLFGAALTMSILVVGVTGCATPPPSTTDNICAIFQERRSWYDAAKKSRDRWRVPITVMMAIMHQESRFVATAKPPRKKILGIIPGPRPSDSYGYSQALSETWEQYQRSAGHYWASRDDFDDAIDFIGWYNAESVSRLGLAPTSTEALYLAYHEGHGGYSRGTYRDKPWLLAVAKKVANRADVYNRQLQSCSATLERKRWFEWLS